MALTAAQKLRPSAFRKMKAEEAAKPKWGRIALCVGVIAGAIYSLHWGIKRYAK